jgi:hypothetical protein
MGVECLWREQTSALGPRNALEEAISFARSGDSRDTSECEALSSRGPAVISACEASPPRHESRRPRAKLSAMPASKATPRRRRAGKNNVEIADKSVDRAYQDKRPIDKSRHA